MKIDTALYLNEKRHRQLWYFIVDTILSMSHPDTLVGAYLPAFTVGRYHKYARVGVKLPYVKGIIF